MYIYSCLSPYYLKKTFWMYRNGLKHSSPWSLHHTFWYVGVTFMIINFLHKLIFVMLVTLRFVQYRLLNCIWKFKRDNLHFIFLFFASTTIFPLQGLEHWLDGILFPPGYLNIANPPNLWLTTGDLLEDVITPCFMFIA